MTLSSSSPLLIGILSAARIARKLKDMGFHPVRPLAGGIHAWQDAGFEIVQMAG